MIAMGFFDLLLLVHHPYSVGLEVKEESSLVDQITTDSSSDRTVDPLSEGLTEEGAAATLQTPHAQRSDDGGHRVNASVGGRSTTPSPLEPNSVEEAERPPDRAVTFLNAWCIPGYARLAIYF